MFCMFQVGFLICDPTVAKPDLLKDKFWDSVIPSQLPYTKVKYYQPAAIHQGSTLLQFVSLCHLDVETDNQHQ